MATSEEYRGFDIRWLETGEQFVALVRVPGEQRPPAVITATVEEGMPVLKDRTRGIIDAGRLEGYRPTAEDSNSD